MIVDGHTLHVMMCLHTENTKKCPRQARLKGNIATDFKMEDYSGQMQLVDTLGGVGSLSINHPYSLKENTTLTA